MPVRGAMGIASLHLSYGLPVIASAAKQSPLHLRRFGLLRFARNNAETSRPVGAAAAEGAGVPAARAGVQRGPGVVAAAAAIGAAVPATAASAGDLDDVAVGCGRRHRHGV